MLRADRYCRHQSVRCLASKSVLTGAPCPCAWTRPQQRRPETAPAPEHLCALPRARACARAARGPGIKCTPGAQNGPPLWGCVSGLASTFTHLPVVVLAVRVGPVSLYFSRGVCGCHLAAWSHALTLVVDAAQSSRVDTTEGAFEVACFFGSVTSTVTMESHFFYVTITVTI